VTDDPGVMGNLPRSRPGRRSDKRASGSGAKARPGSAGKAKGKATGARTQASRAKTSTSRTGSTRPARERAKPPRESAKPSRQPAGGPDPLGDAVRVAAKLAGAGMGVAAGILRRLPRP
jgi:hypothetical protein